MKVHTSKIIAKFFILAAATAPMSLLAHKHHNEKPATTKTAETITSSKVVKNSTAKKPTTIGEQTSATLGREVAKQVGRAFESNKKDLSFSREFFIASFTAELEGKEPLLTQEESQKAMEAFQQFQMAAQKEKAEKNEAAGKKFLVENKKKKGVITTKSGLQYKVITAGTGASPSESSEVLVHYKGKLVDGEIFDSSFQGDKPTDKDEPASFSVDGVIPGWTEALQLMKEGAHWEVYIPSELAYGSRPYPVPANSLLIFDVHFISKKEETTEAVEAPAVETPAKG